MFIIKYTYSLVHLLSLLSWSSSWQNSINEDMSKKIMTPSKERRSLQGHSMQQTGDVHHFCHVLLMRWTTPGATAVFTQKWFFWAEIHGVSGHFNVFSYVFPYFPYFFKCLFIKIMLFESEIEGFQLERLRSEPGKLFFSARNMFKGDFAALRSTHISERVFRNG